MECKSFEENLSEYLDGVISKAEGALFREHALQCRGCRLLLDEVKGALRDCKTDDAAEMPAALESSLLTIAAEHSSFACPAFEDLITEFLDGFVPATVYHRFEEHASLCDNCSNLLTDVVYAVAACHSVHTYEEVEAPQSLLDCLNRIAKPKGQEKSLANKVRAFAANLMVRTTPNPRWGFATASSLVFATVAFLLFGFSDDGTFAGIYRQAQLKFGQIYSQGAGIYSRKDELAARIERVGHGIGEIWDSLGGAEEAKSKMEIDKAKQNQKAGKKHIGDEKK